MPKQNLKFLDNTANPFKLNFDPTFANPTKVMILVQIIIILNMLNGLRAVDPPFALINNFIIFHHFGHLQEAFMVDIPMIASIMEPD